MDKPDQLNELFRLQRELNERIGIHLDGMTEMERQEKLLNYCRAMSQEIAELTDCVPWKWWAKYQTYDIQNARIEVVDLLHFVISAAQVLEMTANDLFEAYTKKHQVNLDRQATGYEVKDPNDGRHI
jgi:dimeric dUTPase (all-alpha-NTP-PPase superfamily)